MKSFGSTHLIHYIDGYLRVNCIASGSCNYQGSLTQSFVWISYQFILINKILNTNSFAR